MSQNHRIRPGAEPFAFEGGSTGVLLLHGFTGSPASLRPLGEFLAGRGLSVACPRLPGHGTHWEDLVGVGFGEWHEEAEQAFDELSSRCSDVAVVALSMGACLAIHLAAKHADRVRAVALVNPYVVDPRLGGAPLLRLFTRSRKGVINDIKKPGQDEIGYERMPIVALSQLAKLLKETQRELPAMRAPLIVFHSRDDHLVKAANTKLVMERAGSKDKELVELANSYHVATLDYDADLIAERVLALVQSNT